MKIIVDVPKQDYIYITKKHCLPSCDEKILRKTYYEMVLNSVPLEDVRTEILKLDDINTDYPMDRTIHISRNEVLQIIDKYRK